MLTTSALLLLAHSPGTPDPCSLAPAPGGTGPTLYWSDAATGRIQRTRSLAWPLTGRAPARVPAPVIETVVRGLDIPIDFAIDEGAGEIYWIADSLSVNKIQKARLDGVGGITTLHSGLVEPRGLALDPCAQRMYWCDRTEDRIYRSPMGGGTLENLGIDGLSIPLAISLDRTNGLMYWTDAGAGKVRRACLSGDLTQDLVTDNFEHLRGIALDHAAGKMYFVTWHWIQRTNLDGTDLEILVDTSDDTTALNYPNNITLDLAAGKMYWTSTTLIKRANLDGSNVETFLDGLVNASGILLTP
jgi:sugar lactone lactonase YvrE